MTTGAICGKRRRVVIARRVLLVSSALLAVVILPTLRLPFLPSTTTDQEIGAAAPNSINAMVPLGLQNRDVKTRLLNASYPSGCFKVFSDEGFGSTIPLRNGDWNNGQTDLSKEAYFGIVGKKILFADLTGDGRQEAVVPTACGQEASTEAYNEIFVIDTSSPELNVLSRLSPEDWGDSLGLTWNTSDVRVKDGLLAVSFRLGGYHAQPDWDATTAFKWDGSRFVRFGFEAHGEPGGSHPSEVIRKDADLSALQLGEQNEVPSIAEANGPKAQLDPNVANTPGAQGSSGSSAEAMIPQGATSIAQASTAIQPTSEPPKATVQQWLALAEAEYEHGDYNGALSSCEAALQIDPHDSQAIQLRAKIADTEKVLGTSATAQGASASQALPVQQWLALAESQFERIDFKGALQSCNAALQIDPNNSQALQLKEKIASTMKVLGDTQ